MIKKVSSSKSCEFYIIYYLEYNTSKSAQHPTSEGENVRWTHRKLWEHKDKKPYG